MRERRGNVRGAAAWMSALLFLVGTVGCEGESQTGPTTAELSRERKALEVKNAADKAKKVDKPVVAVMAAGESDAPSFGAVDLGFTYDFTDKRDPFRSFKWDQLARAQRVELSGPLEQYDLSQLSLVAVVWKMGDSKALVQDPSGQSYIVGKGAKIGKNKGYIVKIGDNLVKVKETYFDYLGQETTKDIEMRIRRSHGG